jgi:hypothetical protein
MATTRKLCNRLSWPVVWDEILDALELHDSALLTGYDEYGFPFSVRCMPIADRKTRRLNVEIPSSSGIQPGKASILMHSHNEELWDLAQFLIRGTLVKTAEGYYFVPASASGTPRPASGLDAFRTLRGIRNRGNAYLKNRRKDRPAIPWDDVARLQEQATRWREQHVKDRVQ